MRVISWNVNGIRARADRLAALLDRHDPDVICLQETKATDADLPMGLFMFRGYEVVHHGQPSYNGVAIASKHPIEDVQRGFPGDPLAEERRVLAATIQGVRIYNLYVPNGKSPEHPDYRTKLAWYRALTEHTRDALGTHEALLQVGDYNVAPTDADVHDPEAWREHIHCTTPEREALQDLMGTGLQDLYRLGSHEETDWTWWSYQGGALHKGEGLRIDLALGSAPVAKACTGVAVDREERKKSTGPGNPSDHAPVLVDLELAP